jgi:hypothetical protein
MSDDRKRLRLVAFRAVSKGTLRGFATVQLPIGLVIHDCPICESNGKAWAMLPGKPQVDSDGKPVRDARGKLAYSAILEWDSRKLRNAFSDCIVAAVRDQHPNAFEQGETP